MESLKDKTSKPSVLLLVFKCLHNPKKEETRQDNIQTRDTK